uniref:Alkylated DNA repair protein AlkB homologue 8 N-terminal domain-containing protein n=1 Tax=Knipowitschia caucasica TaxID=637954 RepID=A0AAV2M415_KNICA
MPRAGMTGPIATRIIRKARPCSKSALQHKGEIKQEPTESPSGQERAILMQLGTQNDGKERPRSRISTNRAAPENEHHDSVKLIKFADDTTLIGLISNNDESAYRREVDRLVSWCSGNNLELNAQKTVEMIVDFRKSTVPPPPPSVMDSPITSVESFRFLGTTITQDLKWEPTISSLIKKAQQRMYFLRQLRKAKLPAQMLVQFYTAIIESILTSSITVWFAGATVRDKQRLQRIVRSAEEVIGRSLPSLQDLDATQVTEHQPLTDPLQAVSPQEDGCSLVDHGPEERDDHGPEERDDHGPEERDDHGPEERDDHGPEERDDHGPEERDDHGLEERDDHGPEERDDHGLEERDDHGPEERDDHGPEERGQPRSRGEGRPRSRGEERPRSRGEGRPRSRGEGRPRSRGEGRPRSRGEGRPRSKGEGRPWSRQVDTCSISNGPEERYDHGPEERDDHGPEERDDHGPEERDDHGPEERDDHGPEERDDHGLEERDDHGPEERDDHGLEERDDHGPEERDNHGPEERDDHGLEERDDHGLEERDDHGLEERDDHGLEERDDHGPEERDDHGPEERDDPGPEERDDHGLEERDDHGLKERDDHGPDKSIHVPFTLDPVTSSKRDGGKQASLLRTAAIHHAIFVPGLDAPAATRKLM